MELERGSHAQKDINTRNQDFWRTLRTESPLGQDPVQNLGNYLDFCVRNPNLSIMWPDQLVALSSVYAHLDAGTSIGSLVFPTGAGKSAMIAHLVGALGLSAVVLSDKVDAVENLAAEIGRFTGEAPGVVHGNKNDIRNITVGTYAALRSKKLPPAQLIIADEAHRGIGEQTSQALLQLRSSQRGNICIGFTATPDFNEKHGIDKLFGRRMHEMGIVEAVRSRMCAPFTVLSVDTGIYADNMVGSNISSIQQEALLNTIDAVVQTLFPGMKTVIGCGTIDFAEKVSDVLGENAVAIHSALPLEEQDMRKSAHRQGEATVLTGVRLMSESYNDPGIGVAIVAGASTPVNVMQLGGRALRIDPDNPDKMAYIVHIAHPDDRGAQYHTEVGLARSKSEVIGSLIVENKIYGSPVQVRVSQLAQVNTETEIEEDAISLEERVRTNIESIRTRMNGKSHKVAQEPLPANEFDLDAIPPAEALGKDILLLNAQTVQPIFNKIFALLEQNLARGSMVNVDKNGNTMSFPIIGVEQNEFQKLSAIFERVTANASQRFDQFGTKYVVPAALFELFASYMIDKLGVNANFKPEILQNWGDAVIIINWDYRITENDEFVPNSIKFNIRKASNTHI